jgi:hypothetical protein
MSSEEKSERGKECDYESNQKTEPPHREREREKQESRRSGCDYVLDLAKGGEGLCRSLQQPIDNLIEKPITRDSYDPIVE